MFDTNFVFSKGRLTITLDGGAGSSGKGKLGSFLCEHATNWTFACNTFMPQAGHWVKLDGDGRLYFYRTFNSCAYLTDRYDKLYIGPGATIELEAFWRELAENNIPRRKIGISPVTSILQRNDSKFEMGLCDIEGQPTGRTDGGYLIQTGSTAHGCGVNRARRVLRHPTALYAKDVPELQEFLCDVPDEIINRLKRGEAGLLEVAQGFQLSYLLPDFFPYTTSRNCTVAAGLDDLMVPPVFAGNVVLNFRTFPIRINSWKYLDKHTGVHLNGDEVLSRTGARPEQAKVEALESADIVVREGNSGPSYGDQAETSWEEVTRQCGSPEPLGEDTSVTRLRRRIFTFSRQNVADAIRHNETAGELFLSLNFANYVDDSIKGVRGNRIEVIPPESKLHEWLAINLNEWRDRLKFIGTGERTNDMVQLP